MQGTFIRTGLAAFALAGAAALSACGDSDNDKGGSKAAANTLDVSIAEQGKAAKFTVPKSAKGGLTTLKFTNNGKAPHSAQLVLVKGDHKPQELSKAFSGESTDKFEWARLVGGVGFTPPGQSGTGVVQIEPGHYFVVDASQDEGPPAVSELDVSAGESGSLPATDTKVTAAEAGKDKWRWDISGALKAGPQDVTFKSEGKEAVHFIGAIQVKGDVDEKTLLKAMGTKKAEQYVDMNTFTNSAVLDGGKSQVVQFTLSKPGRWLLFCPLTDRGEKEEHDKQGLAKIVTVK